MDREAENLAQTPGVLLVGHPHAPIGMGAHLRGLSRALRAAHVPHRVHDIYKGEKKKTAEHAEFASVLTDDFSAPVRIFAINGDEVNPVQRMIDAREPGAFEKGYNIVYPLWELPKYPAVWAAQIDGFDEVWAASKFVESSLRETVQRPIFHMPLAVEPSVPEFRSRRHFSIPEHRYAVLFFFDALSFASRKNPWAAIEVFRRAIERRPLFPVQLVLKVNNSTRDPDSYARLLEAISGFSDQVTLINETLTDNEVKNLVRCCDCFLSMHRSEGFGLGPAEAMFYEKPVIVTGWSGNMDYMNPDVSIPVDYRLIPLEEGDYPHWEGQSWADPDVAQATDALLKLIDYPEAGYALGARAGDFMRKFFSSRHQGLRYRDRIEEIGCEIARSTTS